MKPTAIEREFMEKFKPQVNPNTLNVELQCGWVNDVKLWLRAKEKELNETYHH